MKKNTFQLFDALSLLMVFLSACNLPSASDDKRRNDLGATASAAVMATQMQQLSMSATINAAIAATQQAAPTSAAAAAPGSTSPNTAPTPVPTVVVNTTTTDYYTLSQEELAALINQTYAEAMAYSQQAAYYTAQAVVDSAVSYPETQTITVQVSAAGTAINEVEQMMAAYSSIYGTYASETLAVMQSMEQDLEAINANLSAINQVVAQGAEAANQAIDQLNAAALTTNQKIQDAQQKSQNWTADLQKELDQREKSMLEKLPNQIANDWLGTLDSAKKYFTSFRSSLEDRKISPKELDSISQLGANAAASLKKHGNSRVPDLGNQIDTLTRQASRGQIPQARTNLDKAERSLPRR